ncbi:coadhesin-like [Montipora foliosa]|uniref:coadhesin-like n=1 Tax=Montipora foliosa TaxID=591990 RepID=UPI0035F1304C
MKQLVTLISLLSFGFCFSLPVEDIDRDPVQELESLLDTANDHHIGCNDISAYWCQIYSTSCSHTTVHTYCPKTCGGCSGVSGWGAWSSYGPCSKSCHNGYQTRTRECKSSSSSACQGPAVQSRRCNVQVNCPSSSSSVHLVSALTSNEGTWSSWGPFTECTKSCGAGTQSRTRTCSNTARPQTCQGPFKQRQPCNQNPCPVDGGWTPWNPFGPCSASCGGGVQHKYRKCKNPAPKHGGKQCSGDQTASRVCNTHPCAVNGHWSSWTALGPCSKSCGRGMQYRRRTCTNPPPSSGGKSCQGPSHQSNECNRNACPVHGHWSPWGAFGPCSKRCGGGMQHRSRSCDNPHPSNGGKNCVGPSHQSNACNTHSCPVNGQWTSWSAFGPCSKSCDGGKKYRRRSCSNPPPSNGGRSCRGPWHQSNACNTHTCAVDGHWSSWSAFGPCSKTCGGGVQYRKRTCNNPPPSGGGKNCHGPPHQSNSCNTQACSGCRDIKEYKFCKTVMMTYRCWQYYGYCRKTCSACGRAY